MSAKAHPSKKSDASILVVDDEPSLREMLAIFFRREGYEISLAPDFHEGRVAIEGAPKPFGLVVTDLMMPGGSGLDLLSAAKARSASTEVIVMTAHGAVETAVEAMRRGAYDFIAKPFQNSELRALVEKALEKRALVSENIRLRAEVARTRTPSGLLGHSEAMRSVLELISKIANTRSTVLITGESGTGKERVAKAIHDASDRRDKPFLVVNCGAIPEQLLESELFGHEKGSFTGAVTKKRGIFRDADGGTVFLDEVGELPASMQVKLLRVLQEKKVRGVGESAESAVEVRVLAATNRVVEEEVKNGRFRQDLYYRLNVLRVDVPPLRQRREDVRELTAHFLTRCAEEHGKDVRGLSADALRALDAYDFPGNVRELENILERAVALATSTTLGIADLPAEVSGSAAATTSAWLNLPEEGCKLDDVVSGVERTLIEQALERTGGNRTGAAKILGVTFRSFRYRLVKLGIEVGDGDDADTDEQGPISGRKP